MDSKLINFLEKMCISLIVIYIIGYIITVSDFLIFIYVPTAIISLIIFVVATFNMYLNSFEEDDITYIHAGKNVQYDNIEDILEKENLDIRYPRYFPYNATIKEVGYIESENKIFFTFNKNQIQFTIKKNTTIDENFIKNADTIIVKDLCFYINERKTCFVAYASINNDLYTLQCDSKEELLKMINSIE